MKTITLFTANYYPEDTAIGLYTTQFARFLEQKGYSVNVITGFPYYPKWQIFEEYRNTSVFFEENIHGINVYRYKQFVPKKITFIGRIGVMLSLLYGNFYNSKKIVHSDLVICVVPFTLSIITAYFLAKKTKSKLWIHVQDFEFDLAFETGVLQKKWFFIKLFKKIVFAVESFLLNKAQVISSISNTMIANAKKKSAIEDYFYFPNWISSTTINPNTYKHHNYISKDKFTLLYSGNIGEKQDWDLFEKLCEHIYFDNFEIVIVGDGAYLQQLKNRVSRFTFVTFCELVPYAELSDLLCSANAHFLFQKTNVKDTVMPSKILGMMASAKPCILTGSATSEVANVFLDKQMGYYFYDNNVNAIINALNQIQSNHNNAKKMGNAARQYVIEQFSEENILCNFEKKINNEI